MQASGNNVWYWPQWRGGLITFKGRENPKEQNVWTSRYKATYCCLPPSVFSEDFISSNCSDPPPSSANWVSVVRSGACSEIEGSEAVEREETAAGWHTACSASDLKSRVSTGTTARVYLREHLTVPGDSGPE
ncbi:hypothetical protein POSPLADRAFT_1033861 [Postia placenta MAD-698-R-SB12]|uniref:Uncharacterized protein n=1 Tax=Postia placenta MAD-698-R-SB12 TaxID=670580 RepID=A0A1X6N132_9APHY|nr:hypothetical protein POSPLADRAFT_1033861 [Postia placenta MAD-698-R-SB12]OSX62182.1 hypothetical protein POSPLADRAFT_1033861 [Postia placenta MAD-698-R-SB12]